MRYLLSILFVGIFLFSVVDAQAQGRGRTGSDRSGSSDGPRVIIGERSDADARGRTGRRERAERRDRSERRDDDRWDVRRQDEQMRGRKTKKGKGPAFCRSGAGHPVHGRSWCAEKGWGLGNDRYRNDRYDDRYERDRTWGDIIFGRTPRRTDDRVTLSSGVLQDVLGRRTLDRFRAYSRELGLRDALNGRWSERRDGSRLLRLQSDDVPVAVLYDDNRDGRVDLIRLLR